MGAPPQPLPPASPCTAAALGAALDKAQLSPVWPQMAVGSRLGQELSHCMCRERGRCATASALMSKSTPPPHRPEHTCSLDLTCHFHTWVSSSPRRRSSQVCVVVRSVSSGASGWSQRSQDSELKQPTCPSCVRPEWVCRSEGLRTARCGLARPPLQLRTALCPGLLTRSLLI